MDFQPYNKKAFLLPDSINSAAMYHAKLFPDGKYIFRIHDCLGGIRLIGELKAESDFVDAVNKLQALADAAQEFAFYIFHLSQEKYPDRMTPKIDESSLPDCLHDRYCDQQTTHHTCKQKAGCNFQLQQ